MSSKDTPDVTALKNFVKKYWQDNFGWAPPNLVDTKFGDAHTVADVVAVTTSFMKNTGDRPKAEEFNNNQDFVAVLNQYSQSSDSSLLSNPPVAPLGEKASQAPVSTTQTDLPALTPDLGSTSPNNKDGIHLEVNKDPKVDTVGWIMVKQGDLIIETISPKSAEKKYPDQYKQLGAGSTDPVQDDAVTAAKVILGDANKDGKLTKEEALAYFDKNGDNHITDKELGGLNGLVGTTTTVGTGESEHDVTTIGGVKVEDQDQLDKQNFVKDYQQLKASSNPIDQKKAAQLDQFFAWASKASDADKQGFADSVAIAQALKLKSGKNSNAFADENDPEWQATMNMTPEQRAAALKEANDIKSFQGPSTTVGYSGVGMQTQAELEAESERKRADHSGMMSPPATTTGDHSGMFTTPTTVSTGDHSGMNRVVASPSSLADNSHSGMMSPPATTTGDHSGMFTTPTTVSTGDHSGMNRVVASPSSLADNSHSGMMSPPATTTGDHSGMFTTPTTVSTGDHSGMNRVVASPSSLADNSHSGMMSPPATTTGDHSGMFTTPTTVSTGDHSGMNRVVASPSSLADNSHSGMMSPPATTTGDHSGMFTTPTTVSTGDHSGMNSDFNASLVSDLNPTGSIQKDKDLKAFFASVSANQQTNPDFNASLVSDLNPTGSIQKDKDLKAFFASVSANQTTSTANHSGMMTAPTTTTTPNHSGMMGGSTTTSTGDHSGMKVQPVTFPPTDTPVMRPARGVF